MIWWSFFAPPDSPLTCEVRVMYCPLAHLKTLERSEVVRSSWHGKGTAIDAHDHVASAADGGATAAVVERYVDVAIPQVRVSDGRRAAALVAHHIEGEPTRELRVTAVTGTNGKTTCSLLIRHLFSSLGPSASIGTLGMVGADGQVRPESQGLTTPGPVQIAKELRALVEAGVTMVTIEASSHALDQHRLDGLEVDTAVLTNLTQDHFDYHTSFDAYREAKARILLLVKNGAVWL